MKQSNVAIRRPKMVVSSARSIGQYSYRRKAALGRRKD